MISFGGTSLVLTMAGIGILLSIARRGRPVREAAAARARGLQAGSSPAGRDDQGEAGE
jgi:hypothetical protein